MSRAVMRQALEALENSRVFVTTREKIKHPEGTEWYDEAIAALRAALMEPVVVQEPVAIKDDNGLTLKAGWDDLPVGAPLYTTPPRREWQGLSKDEALKLWGRRSDGPSNIEITSFAFIIEAALKERNHG